MFIATFRHKEARKQYCVYEVFNQNCELIFAYYTKFEDVMRIPELSQNPAFDENQIITIKIVSMHDTFTEAQNALGLRLRELPETPMLNRTVFYNRIGAVKCVQTGAVYQNASQAAKMLGLSKSQLSQHLKRNPHYKSVKGMTFEYHKYKE